jgi:hypothetical protein
MPKKRSWKEHAVDYIRATERCPGEVPPTGLPTDLMTEDEFKLTLSSLHAHDRCNHFRSEVLGLDDPKNFVELPGHGAAPLTEDDLERGKSRLTEGGPSSTVDRFKRALHTYVDLIELKEGGKLFIPHQILKLDTFLKTFFEVK